MRLGRKRSQGTGARKNGHRAGREAAYRGARQGLPGSPTSTFVGLEAASADNPRKLAETPSQLAVRELTGVPSKRYRGAQQKLPGSPTNVTGVPNKRYRGARQKLPGSPTSRLHRKCCKSS